MDNTKAPAHIETRLKEYLPDHMWEELCVWIGVLQASEGDMVRTAMQARLERENALGGQAREVVLGIAQWLDVKLSENVKGGDLWSPENMARATTAVEELTTDLFYARLSASEQRMHHSEHVDWLKARLKVSEAVVRAAGLQPRALYLAEKNGEWLAGPEDVAA